MNRNQAEVAYGAIAGTAVAIVYWIAKAWWVGDITNAFTVEMVGAAVVGAIAGSLALMIRVLTR